MKSPLVSVFAALLALSGSLRAQEPEKNLSFSEVYQLIKTNIPEVSESELSEAAALGLLKQLSNRVQLVDTNASTLNDFQPITRQTVYNENLAYIRVKQVTEALPSTFQKALTELAKNHKIQGVVIDLRFASGSDYESAAKVADLFVKEGHILLKIGGKALNSASDARTLNVPLAVLINQETRGAAEALAGSIRELGIGLTIGQTTAGQGRVFETFTLSNGQKIRLGTIAVELPGGKAIPSTGLKPDIEVAVAPSEEEAFYQDPYLPSPRALPGSETLAGATNRFGRPFNEAELVRRHRDGIDVDPTSDVPGEPEKPVIMDPALARALDFLKGVAVLQKVAPL